LPQKAKPQQKSAVCFSLTVLDLGCGSLKRGLIGVDIQRTSSVDIVADAHHLPLRDHSVSECFAYSVLEHVDNPLMVVREIHRVLRENGWLKIRVPRDSRLRLDTFFFCVFFDVKQLRQQYTFLKAGKHKYQFSTRSLTRILEENGFSTTLVTFSVMRRERKRRFLIDIYQYLRNIYVVAKKMNSPQLVSDNSDEMCAF